MWKKWVALSAVSLLLLFGCSKNETVEQEQEVPNQEVQEETNQPEKEEVTFHFPLTGIESKEEVDGRAVAVMVNNDPLARPQSGLHKADLIYEILAEGNVTRFLAIFQSEQPEIVGPVRSARDYYIELAKGYDSLYIAHGNSPDAKVLLDTGYIDNLNGLYYDGTLFERASFRKAPHNSYIRFSNILKGADQNGYEMKQAPDSLLFLTEEVKELVGSTANKISISYYNRPAFNSTFEYDEPSQKYKRFSGGTQTVDFDSKDPVLVDNIFIVETMHKIIDNDGRRDIDLASGGRAFLIQKGQKFEVEWKNVGGKILPYQNGKAVGLVPGKTWISLIPTTPGLEKDVSFE